MNDPIGDRVMEAGGAKIAVELFVAAARRDSERYRFGMADPKKACLF